SPALRATPLFSARHSQIFHAFHSSTFKKYSQLTGVDHLGPRPQNQCPQLTWRMFVGFFARDSRNRKCLRSEQLPGEYRAKTNSWLKLLSNDRCPRTSRPSAASSAPSYSITTR